MGYRIVQMVVHPLCRWCMGMLTVPAHASNMHMCTEYFWRTLFVCPGWTCTHRGTVFWTDMHV
jgi:hypothetical protein